MSPTGYRDLGIRPVINAAATLTRLGGSLMPETVLDAMREAAGSFVDLTELQRRAGERIAELTHNEAAYISSGAAAGITLAVAACISESVPERLNAFPALDGLTKRDVIVQRSERNGYDYAAQQTGARLVEVEGSAAALEAAITGQTACVLWFAGTHYAEGALPLEEVVPIVRRQGVPVLVDAAAQVPPVSTLWHFTRDLGADAVIISGGKGLRGPQSSGLVLGRQAIIDGCRTNGSPNHGIGRPMKVGKEEMMGLLAAIEWSLAQDEPATIAGYDAIVKGWIAGLAGIPGIAVEHGFPSEAGQPHSRCLIRILPESRWTRDELIRALRKHDPAIAVGHDVPEAIALNPQTLQPGEDAIVLAALKEILAREPS